MKKIFLLCIIVIMTMSTFVGCVEETTSGLSANGFTFKYTGGKYSVLANDNLKELKEFTIPADDGNGRTVTHITAHGFEKLEKVETIRITTGITHIEANAFFGCKELKEVYIPRTVKSIGDCAFGDCINLETIKFDGTLDEWERITLDSDWRKNAAYKIELIYNYVE